VIALQHKILRHLAEHKGRAFTADQLAEAIGVAEEAETVFKILRHAAANEDHGVKRTPGRTPSDAGFGMV
jgi:glucose-6-phosphate isomerase